MRKIILPILAFGVLFFISCGDTETTDNPSATDTVAATDTAPATSNDEFQYDASLEPLTVGAKLSKKLADTLGVKMYEFTVKPGDSAALHKHPDHIVYVLQGGTLEISINGGDKQKMELKTGVGFVSAGITDAGKNIGKTTIKLLVADIYRPRSK